MENQYKSKFKINMLWFILVTSLLSGFSFAFVFRNFEKTASEISVEKRLETLVKKDPAYLDASLILQADTNYKV